MTSRSRSAQIAVLTFAGAVVGSTPGSLWAQQASTSAGTASRPRTTDERVNTELATPPPVNSDYRRAAEGTLPVVPGGTAPATGAGPATGGTAPATGAAIDPAARPFAGYPSMAAARMSPGTDVALLIQHAVSMGIDGTTLMGLAEANKADAEGGDAVKGLMAKAQDEMKQSKELLTQAAAAGSGIDGASPVRKFYGAANNYLTTLGKLSGSGASSPNDKAQLSLVNHAVKAVMEGTLLNQLAAGSSASPSTNQLLEHARMMKDEGTKTLEQMAGTSPVDPSGPPSPTLLAQHGKDLIDAANQVGPMTGGLAFGPGGSANGAMNHLINSQGPNPGQLQDNRPEIIGGTYGTGSQTAGTATGAGAARNVRNATEGADGTLNVPTPSGAPGSGTSSYGVGNNNTPPTQSTAGPRPR